MSAATKAERPIRLVRDGFVIVLCGVVLAS
jgi:hypothetical protein